MSATRRLPQITTLLGVASLGVAVATKPAWRDGITRSLGLRQSGGAWRLLAITLAVLNLKNLPFVWHIRLFRGLIYHLFFQSINLPPTALFTPMITPTHTPWAETDYNFHKSNSTYFSDLDIARTHLVSAVLRKGMRQIGTAENEQGVKFSFKNTTRAAGYKKENTRKVEAGGVIAPLGTTTEASTTEREGSGKQKSLHDMTEEEWLVAATQPGSLLIALGGVSCHFHREIGLYKRYEIWTRLLTWDRKWLYIVSHFVEQGTFKPESYVLQPWKSGRPRMVENLTGEEKAKLKRKVFASSIAKYVVKKGRLTIPPEMVLERSQMLPPRPEGTPVLGGWTPGPSKNPSGANSPSRSPPSPPSPQTPKTPNSAHDVHNVLTESLFPDISSTSSQAPWKKELQIDSGIGAEHEWTWETVEEKRRNGLKLAAAYDGLDALKDVFDVQGPEGGAMGEYTDLAFGW